MAKIELDGGKYTVVNELSEGGGFYALRYGRVWSNLAGDKLALSMFHEIERLQKRLDEYDNTIRNMDALVDSVILGLNDDYSANELAGEIIKLISDLERKVGDIV